MRARSRCGREAEKHGEDVEGKGEARLGLRMGEPAVIAVVTTNVRSKLERMDELKLASCYVVRRVKGGFCTFIATSSHLVHINRQSFIESPSTASQTLEPP